MDDSSLAAPTTGIDPERADAVLNRASGRLATWKKMYLISTALHYGFSLLAMAATVLSGILPAIYDPNMYAWLFASLAVAATLFVFLVAFASPSKQARTYIAAWRTLDNANNQWLLTRRIEDLASIVEAVRQGEELLSGKDPF